MSQGQQAVAVDEAAAALSEFLTSLSRLKESGLLGMINYLANNGEDAFLAIATDPAIMRLLALAASIAQGVMKTDAETLSKAQNNLSDIGSCGLTALGRVNLYEPRKLGLLGAADRLMDPDVGTSLWLVLEVLRGLGSCVRSRARSR